MACARGRANLGDDQPGQQGVGKFLGVVRRPLGEEPGRVETNLQTGLLLLLLAFAVDRLEPFDRDLGLVRVAGQGHQARPAQRIGFGGGLAVHEGFAQTVTKR